jgi:hypothetical protein
VNQRGLIITAREAFFEDIERRASWRGPWYGGIGACHGPPEPADEQHHDSDHHGKH